MFYLVEVSCAINGVFLAEKLVYKHFKAPEKKALNFFGKFLCPVLAVIAYLMRYLFLNYMAMELPLHMGIGLLWGFFMGCTAYSAKVRIIKRSLSDQNK